MLYLGDCTKVMKTLKANCVDLIFADPPYFLSNDGLSIRSGKVVSVNKGEWDKRDNYDSTYMFTYSWLKECHRILKPTSSIWVSGTHHNIFEIKKVMDDLGFRIINLVIWQKTDPPPLIYKNKLKFSHEILIWAKKGRSHFFNYDLAYSLRNSELGDVWKFSAVQNHEKKFGYHPTQKPERLLERIIRLTTNKNDVVLDPFMGSGTTCFVAKKLQRQYIGIELEEEYFSIAKRRIDSIKANT